LYSPEVASGIATQHQAPIDLLREPGLPVTTEIRSVAPQKILTGIVLALATFQVAQGWIRKVEGFPKSYWVVTYDYGFVRRGLAGELLQALPGPVTESMVVAAARLTGIVPVVALILLAIVLLRNLTAPRAAMALLLMSSPFTLDEFLINSRPDQFGLAVLVVLAIFLRRLRGAQWWALIEISGAVMGALALIHEGNLLFYGVVALPMIMSDTSRRGRTRAVGAALFFLPSAVAGLCIAAAGLGDARLAHALANDPVVRQIMGTGDQALVAFMDDGVRDSFALVASLGPHKMGILLIWGLLAGAIHVFWLGRWSRAATVAAFRYWIYWLPVVLAAGFSFATGVDWNRWFCVFGSSVMVAISAELIASPPNHDQVNTLPGDLPYFQLPLGIYLTTRMWLEPSAPFMNSLRDVIAWFV
jgi:hypothetical protein